MFLKKTDELILNIATLNVVSGYPKVNQKFYQMK